MYVCMYVCTQVCMYACIFVCIYVCNYLCMYVCIYLCIYVYVCSLYHLLSFVDYLVAIICYLLPILYMYIYMFIYIHIFVGVGVRDLYAWIGLGRRVSHWSRPKPKPKTEPGGSLHPLCDTTQRDQVPL